MLMRARRFVLPLVLSACERLSPSPSPAHSAVVSAPVASSSSSASTAASTREQLSHTLELVMEGAPGAEALYAQIPALVLRERVANAESPFWCTVGTSRELWRSRAPRPIKELHVRCGPDHLAIIRQTEAGLAIGDRLLPLPPEVNVALDPRRQAPPPERDCSAGKPRTLRMELALQRTPEGPDVRLRAAEIGLDFKLSHLSPADQCWTVHLRRAQRANLHCVSADNSTQHAFWVEQNHLYIENTAGGLDELGPARWAIRLPCNTRVEWSSFQYRGPGSTHMPYERTVWRCDARCEELHHDERGELTSAGRACHQRCMDAYTKARFARH